MPSANHQLFKRYLAQSSDFTPFILEVDRADGPYIWDCEGKRYLDFTSGMCSNNLGNRYPDVMDAICEQMNHYLHTMVYGEFVQAPQVDYAQQLCSLLPPSLQMVFYVNSGSEAIEGAIKTARLYTQRKQRISFEGSYHGSTLGAMSLVGRDDCRSAFEPLLPDCQHLPFNDIESLQQITSDCACVVMEVLQSGAGMNPAQPDFLRAVRQRCDETGALLIFDEIQTGFGRTGRLFAFEHYGVVPDILCLAKSMGGGLPLGAFISSPTIFEALNNGHPLIGHATTFGGHPLSCAAGKAALAVLSDGLFLETVLQKEALIRQHFAHPEITQITGKGLFLAAHLRHPEKAEKIVSHCMHEGLILLWLLFQHGALALTPALIIDDTDIVEAGRIFRSALDTP